MFLGILMPLAIVCGFAFLVGIVIVVREFKMLKRAFGTTPSSKPNRSLKEQSLEEFIDAHKLHKLSSPTKPPLLAEEEILRAKAFEQEEDERWLAEISSNLNPAVTEDIELLDTAKSLLQLASDNQRPSKRSPKTATNDDSYHQKEFYKRFVEKKLSDLISAREGVRSR